MNEYSDIAEGMLSERVNREDGPERDGSRAVRQDKSSRGSKLPPSPVPRSESIRTELDAVGVPLDAKIGKASTETVKRSRKRGCSADVPAGTRCKICGELHPQREGRSVKIHVPDRSIDAKTDFKKGRKVT